MKGIYLGKERVKQEYLFTIFKFELLPRKYFIGYDEEDNTFSIGINKFCFGEFKSKTEAKKELISYIKRYQPEDLDKLNERKSVVV